ncbi:DUF192 domain-containing protein [Lentibacter algarum]|nr:DUF192 domain-containing protein [Lentibacter algarum]
MLFLLLGGPVFAACSERTVELRGSWGQARFNVEIVDNNSSRAQGLMHRESLPKSAGMLFVYERPVPLSFWMRNTLIELDMIFVDARGIVINVHERAQPHDETLVHSGAPALAVLEVNGGLAAALGIDAGSEMRFAGFDQSRAAWACK